jgi:RNA polymerase sigma-70 factor (ECF subfamily)
MVTRPDADTDHLLNAAAAGDAHARGRLLERHRPRLRRMVAVRFDRRLLARLDPSDLVQETLAEADRKLDGYLRDRPLPFYPWLRQIAANRLVDVRRFHVRAGRRSVGREEPAGLPAESALELAERLIAGEAPSAGLRRRERQALVCAALDRLAERDREVLVLRYLEQLSTAESAAVLGVSEGAVRVRLLRALRRLRDILSTREGQP